MGADTLGQAADSLAKTDSTAEKADTAQAPVVEKINPPAAPAGPVHFTLYERLVYYRTDIGLGWAYILALLTALLAIVFPLIHMFSNPSTMIRTLIILVVVAVIIGGSLFARI